MWLPRRASADRALLAHPDVAAQRPLAEDVEPAAERVDRDRDLVEQLSDVERLPVVVVVGMGEPVVVEARVAPHQLLHRVQGQVPLHLVVVDGVQPLERVRPGVLHDPRLLPHRSPAEVERQAPAAVERDPVVVEAGGRHHREDRDEAGRRGLRGPPLVLCPGTSRPAWRPCRSTRAASPPTRSCRSRPSRRRRTAPSVPSDSWRPRMSWKT